MSKVPKLFSQAGRGGTGRFVAIAGGVVAVGAFVAIVATHQQNELPTSKVVKTAEVNALPGGLHNTPEQDRLAQVSAKEGAQRAEQTGQSYTPAMAAGVTTRPAAEVGGPALTPQQAPTAPPAGLRVVTPPPPASGSGRASVPITDLDTAERNRPILRRIAATPEDLKRYHDAIADAMKGWDSRLPVTAIDTPETRTPETDVQAGSRAPDIGRLTPAAVSTSDMTRRTREQSTNRVLVPAGRGIFAHTVVAVDSDTGGPIILQADSGPLDGDRLIGTFSKAGGHENLLVVQVNKVVHNGKEIGTSGLVVAPQTMQTAVASSVDQHYLARFLLPAAAAFVQGLGSAIATTSNTIGNVGPLGNTTYTTSLNLPQQLGVGAGAAAAQVGSALQQQAPTGPTIHLDANADVGVMFLTDVKTDEQD